ncbi:hypothetical protein [Acinetobacter guillouiae]|nr:hypothetical protein [Acinetobacter guillouiae]
MLKTSVKNKLEQLKLKGFLRTEETSLNQMIEQGTSFVDMLDFCLDADVLIAELSDYFQVQNFVILLLGWGILTMP